MGLGLWNMHIHRPNDAWAIEQIDFARNYPVIEMCAWVASTVHTPMIASSRFMNNVSCSSCEWRATLL